MAQKNIKDTKDSKKVKEEKPKEHKIEHKKENKKVEKEIVNEIKKEITNKEPKKIQLSPQDAYRFFQEEQNKLKSINEDLENTQNSLLDLDKTIFALSEIKDAKDKEVFVNLGLGVYVKAKLDDLSKVHLATNTKAVLTRSPEKVLEQLKKRKDVAVNSLKRLQEIQMQTQTNLNQLYKFLSAHEQRQKEQNKKQ